LEKAWKTANEELGRACSLMSLRIERLAPRLYQQNGEEHCDASVIAVSRKPSWLSQNRDNPSATIGTGRVVAGAEKSH
jgi:hypothetical protein